MLVLKPQQQLQLIHPHDIFEPCYKKRKLTSFNEPIETDKSLATPKKVNKLNIDKYAEIEDLYLKKSLEYQSIKKFEQYYNDNPGLNFKIVIFPKAKHVNMYTTDKAKESKKGLVIKVTYYCDKLGIFETAKTYYDKTLYESYSYFININANKYTKFYEKSKNHLDGFYSINILNIKKVYEGDVSDIYYEFEDKMKLSYPRLKYSKKFLPYLDLEDKYIKKERTYEDILPRKYSNAYAYLDFAQDSLKETQKKEQYIRNYKKYINRYRYIDKNHNISYIDKHEEKIKRVYNVYADIVESSTGTIKQVYVGNTSIFTTFGINCSKTVINNYYYGTELVKQTTNENKENGNETVESYINPDNNNLVELKVGDKRIDLDNNIGYKIAKTEISNEFVPCLIEMIIPKDARIATNHTDPKFRCDKVIPKKVWIVSDNELIEVDVDQCISSIRSSDFTYHIDYECEEDNFDGRLDQVCVPGIHYYPTRELAIKNYGSGEMKNWLKNNY